MPSPANNRLLCSRVPDFERRSARCLLSQRLHQIELKTISITVDHAELSIIKTNAFLARPVTVTCKELFT